MRSLAELPGEALAYLDMIAESTSCPVDFVSVGPDREQTIRCH